MSEGALIERSGRGRGGGREARRAARAQRKAVKLPYIRRRLPVIDLLSSEAVEIIEHNAETILEEIGIEFRRDPDSLRLWRDAGPVHLVSLRPELDLGCIFTELCSVGCPPEMAGSR